MRTLLNRGGSGSRDRKYNPDGYGCRRRMIALVPVLPVLLLLLPLLLLLALIRRPR